MALEYRLTDPNYTIYHRAALGGLAATIRAWGDSPPEGITPELQQDFVGIYWSDKLTDQEALRRILAASFQISTEKITEGMLLLPGHFIGPERDDLRLLIHNGLCLTFLQHPKMRPGPKEARKFDLKTADDETGNLLTYKAIETYAHQKAQGTGLLDEPKNAKKSQEVNGQFPLIATIPQSVIPGAMTGKKSLQAKADEAILLLFLMVGCSVFLLRPRTYQEKAQACLVVPDVVDLIKFARGIKRLAGLGKDFERFSNTYLGRVVGGAEEAALRFLMDIYAAEIGSDRSVAGCQAIAMGKVAWDKNQVNRSISVKVGGDYPEIGVFKAAYQYLGHSKLIKTKKGESFAIPASPVPELIAANLAAERHWGAHFTELVSDKKDFKQMLFSHKGLNQMAKAIKDDLDKTIIRAFHKAWEMTMGELGERARNDKLDFSRLVEVRREKIRNEILRSKTSDALAGWFLRFCADATKGAALPPLRDDADRIRRLIFTPRYFERFQNLLLFALVSYAGNESKTDTHKGE
ncbi:type I-MYXAN CRISPR-associated Cas8a1/Cmx1 [Laspinema olomoucense]|uniref:type I-MYXAN CRISPR-associated Cas8a1/Cmx1 n=1 Tax=Laspinema olomoucense TaxID=3231600 RepID=UPI0021BB20A3|nr:type I-MYXAN CRISPR-associated Cas8a1/Cmx1 [Laspinema sp. D3d]MCT7973373.1 type I-MYXAN CRISPR-associated Cas8a1/Cmx1 [Laspinema sp. D3d]